MNVAQIEHANTFRDPLPDKSTLLRLKWLCVQHDGAIDHANRLRADLEKTDLPWFDLIEMANQLTRSEMRQKEILDEIIEVAGQITAERAALEVA